MSFNNFKVVKMSWEVDIFLTESLSLFVLLKSINLMPIYNRKFIAPISETVFNEFYRVSIDLYRNMYTFLSPFYVDKTL